MINCKFCNTPFEPVAKAQKLCSDDCREKTKEASRKKWRSKNPDQRKLWTSYTNKWREENPLRSRVTVFRTKSKKLDLPFDLDEEFFIVPETCPVLGVPLDGRTRETCWSVDRLIPEKGYTKENCRIISMKANRLKNNASIEDLEKIIEYIKNSS